MNKDLETASNIIAKLFLLCIPERKYIPMLFRPICPNVGDYMGSGYMFIDQFNELYDYYLENVSSNLHHMVMDAWCKFRDEKYIDK